MPCQVSVTSLLEGGCQWRRRREAKERSERTSSALRTMVYVSASIEEPEVTGAPIQQLPNEQLSQHIKGKDDEERTRGRQTGCERQS